MFLQLATALFIVVGRVWPADLMDHPKAVVVANLVFLYGDDGGSPDLCSKEEHWFDDGIKEPDLGGVAIRVGSLHVLQRMESLSCFTGSSVSIRFSVVVNDAVDICESLLFLQRPALDIDECFYLIQLS
ncbi:hypothetical protein DPMN_075076 [Dreissena polymorpha]|uniref:Secreted protein n=1 Tax=Dreissena polymorpha TaxID=45954 RepID=A0A9D3YL00_DREPO|nr:hypothetical protein DPMN_075076 [Dreissena polymorpha]